MPAFQLKDLKGKRVNIKKLKGKVARSASGPPGACPVSVSLMTWRSSTRCTKEGLEVLAIATDGPGPSRDLGSLNGTVGLPDLA